MFDFLDSLLKLIYLFLPPVMPFEALTQELVLLKLSVSKAESFSTAVKPSCCMNSSLLRAFHSWTACFRAAVSELEVPFWLLPFATPCCRHLVHRCLFYMALLARGWLTFLRYSIRIAWAVTSYRWQSKDSPVCDRVLEKLLCYDTVHCQWLAGFGYYIGLASGSPVSAVGFSFCSSLTGRCHWADHWHSYLSSLSETYLLLVWK